MKLILKISVGVFCGGLALFVAIKMPDWMEQSRRDRIRQIVQSMTPERLASKCGAPIADKTEPFRSADIPGPLQIRFVYYKGIEGLGVAFTFEQQEANQPFNFVAMRSATPEIDNMGGSGEKITDYGEMVSLLPCLNQR